VTTYVLNDENGRQQAYGRADIIRAAAFERAQAQRPFRVFKIHPDGTVHLDVTDCVLDAVGWALLKPYLREERRDRSNASR